LGSFRFISPPKKHKDFTLHDRDEATARALGGGSGPADLSKLEPNMKEQERRNIERGQKMNHAASF